MTVPAYNIALPEIVHCDIETKAYREYVTESLRLRGEDKYLTGRWADIIDTKPSPKQDDRPCVEIAKSIFARIRGDTTERI